MTAEKPVIMWLRRDFRLSDNPALTAAVQTGLPVLFVVLRDQRLQTLGAAAKYRYGLAVAAFAKTVNALGHRVILRTGDALPALQQVIKETGANRLFWNRLYDPTSRAIDAEVKATLTDAGHRCDSFAGHVLFEPWTVQTQQGGFFKVYSPFWRAVRNRDIGNPLNAPSNIPAPDQYPPSERLADWQLERPMNRGAAVLASHVSVGEAAANNRLQDFLAEAVETYKTERDFPAIAATSRLSEPLTYGEISPRQIWTAGWEALERGAAGAEHFLKELVWRDFATHLIFHTPHIETDNWREGWDNFGWGKDSPHLLAWQQGRTGVPFVDAAMRELYVTGTMHNRARMIVASYLTKHLMVDWRVGQAWFADCLIDWDAASNAMGWQWVAGSGPDASPFFRIFNPVTQQAKFDADNRYVYRWLAEIAPSPGAEALSYFEAVPQSWGLSPHQSYRKSPVVDLAAGRATALAAYERNKEKREKNVV